MATLNARVRETAGKGAARKLRASGEIPAVAYGHGEETRSLTVNEHELELLLATINPENTIIDLKVDGGTAAQALIREIQSHPSRPQILHVDFFQVRAGEKLTVEVPIHLSGTPIGVREEGGVLQEVLRELSVECLPSNIPSSIELNVDELGMHDSIHVSDVKLEKAEILNDPELVICTVAPPTIVDLPEPDAEEEDLEPELVGEAGEEAEASAEEEDAGEE